LLIPRSSSKFKVIGEFMDICGEKFTEGKHSATNAVYETRQRHGRPRVGLILKL